MRHEEDDHQKALFEWAQLATVGGIRVGDYLYASANGGKRNIKEAARMKAQGVKAGVSDLHLPIARGGFIGLWIELKAPKGKASQLQIDWVNKMAEQGHMALFCYGWTAAKQTITDYLNLEVK